MMRLVPIVAAAIVMAAGTPVRAKSSADCDAARCSVQETIAQNCPSCSDPDSNHGRYVSCVARATHDPSIPTQCRGKIVRCAARSTCGKPGFVTCLIPTDTCVDGKCSRNQDQTCTTDANCGTRCHIRRSAQSCTDRGGTVGAGSSCCAPCL